MTGNVVGLFTRVFLKNSKNMFCYNVTSLGDRCFSVLLPSLRTTVVCAHSRQVKYPSTAHHCVLNTARRMIHSCVSVEGGKDFNQYSSHSAFTVSSGLGCYGQAVGIPVAWQ